MPRWFLGWFVLGIALARPAAGQHLTPAVGSPDLLSAHWSAESFETRQTLKLFPSAPDHRYEGALIGFATLAIAVAVIYTPLCDESQRNCTTYMIGTSLLAGAAGGLTGALIGGMIPKGKRNE